MSYDGFYGGLSQRGTVNAILDEAKGVLEDIQELKVEFDNGMVVFESGLASVEADREAAQVARDEALAAAVSAQANANAAVGAAISTAADAATASAAAAYVASIENVIRSAWVSVKDPQFAGGAKGDGVTDDTVAIQAALDSGAAYVYFPGGNYVISDPLQNGTPVLNCSTPFVTLAGPGKLTANTTVLRALGVSGVGSKVSVNIEGNHKIACGVYIQNELCVVEFCRIENLHTTTFSSVAIHVVNVYGGVIVRGNIIRGLMSVGDGTAGNGNGMSRAVLISGVANATRESIVEGNYIENILGEEGDAVTVLFTAGSAYLEGRVTIRGNHIYGFTRRGIKVQAWRVRVLDNYFGNPWTSSAQVPNAINVIDFVQGGDHQAVGNTLDGCKFFTQISVFATAGMPVDNILIARNIVKGIGAETNKTCVSITALGHNIHILDNLLDAGLGRAISLGNCTRASILRNIINCADNLTERVISSSSGVVVLMIGGNILLSGDRQCFIGVDTPDATVWDNHARGASTVTVRQQSGGQNVLIIHNTGTGSAMLAGGSSVTGNRLGPNFAIGTATSNTMPGTLYASSAGGPSLQFGSMPIGVGQVVLDSTPTVGQPMGWIALASGAANAITWGILPNIA